MSKTLGMTAQVKFGQFGGKPVQGKVDTGATVSSLHAEQISMNKAQNSVTFVCPPLSSNKITLQLEGSQEVHSADAGGVTRPVVKLDVEIDGVPLENAVFNLNDRSGMDIPVLIGQNILSAGGFLIDPSGEEQPGVAEAQAEKEVANQREQALHEAFRLMKQYNFSFGDLLNYQLSELDRERE